MHKTMEMRPPPNRLSSICKSIAVKNFFLFAIIFFLALALPCLNAQTAPPGYGKSLPAAYGEILFSLEGRTDKQLFIIAQSHRDPFNGENGPDTISAQMDAYRIGQWLIEDQDVELLLPEGFFEREPDRHEQSASAARWRKKKSVWLDEGELRQRLSDDSLFVNAEKLLHESCDVRLRQVEDGLLYSQAVDLLHREEFAPDNIDMELAVLEQAQKRRSAAMLQNAVLVVEEEYRQKRIAGRKAILTVGLDHLNEIIRFLALGRINIASASCDSEICDKCVASLNLLEEGYGVAIIVPRSLADNREALRRSSLDGFGI